jgi:hypothetical protein
MEHSVDVCHHVQSHRRWPLARMPDGHHPILQCPAYHRQCQCSAVGGRHKISIFSGPYCQRPLLHFYDSDIRLVNTAVPSIPPSMPKEAIDRMFHSPRHFLTRRISLSPSGIRASGQRRWDCTWWHTLPTAQRWYSTLPYSPVWHGIHGICSAQHTTVNAKRSHRPNVP